MLEYLLHYGVVYALWGFFVKNEDKKKATKNIGTLECIDSYIRIRIQICINFVGALRKVRVRTTNGIIKNLCFFLALYFALIFYVPIFFCLHLYIYISISIYTTHNMCMCMCIEVDV